MRQGREEVKGGKYWEKERQNEASGNFGIIQYHCCLNFIDIYSQHTFPFFKHRHVALTYFCSLLACKE